MLGGRAGSESGMTDRSTKVSADMYCAMLTYAVLR